jgi:hypothetical protein
MTAVFWGVLRNFSEDHVWMGGCIYPHLPKVFECIPPRRSIEFALLDPKNGCSPMPMGVLGKFCLLLRMHGKR